MFGYPNTELCRLEPGPVACIFQSGGLIQFWMKSAADRGLRFSYCITSGNEPDLGLADYLNFVVDDPQTRQIVLFIEGIRRPEAFMHAAGRALAMGKPILAIKTGVTAKSQAGSQSHTGAIAGDYAAYLAMCERYGIVNYRSLDDLVEAALAFDGGRLPKGPRIGFVTTSGATVDLLYDYAEAEGAAMPDFTDTTKAALLPLMQDGIAPKNPLDVGIPSTLDVAAKLCLTAADDPNIDMVAWASPMPQKGAAWGDVVPLNAMLSHTDKPIVAFGRVIYQVGEEHIAAQRGAGFPFLQGIEPTVRALNGLWFHAARAGRRPGPLPPAPASELTPATLAATLARYGIALPKSQEVASAAEAAAAAQAIGFPVALKIRSPDILHKTEAGGVTLGLDSRDRGEAAADAMAAAARAAQPGVRIDGFLVQEMVAGVEAIVGARSDPLYGPMLLIGAGGVLVELAQDAALRLLPVAASDVTAMIDGLKLATLVAGYRGKPAADRAALEASRAGARALLPRPSRAHRRHRDQPADGAAVRRRGGRRARALARQLAEPHEHRPLPARRRRGRHPHRSGAARHRERRDPGREGREHAEESGARRARRRRPFRRQGHRAGARSASSRTAPPSRPTRSWRCAAPRSGC